MGSRLFWVFAGALVALATAGGVLSVVVSSSSEDLDAAGTADAYFAAWNAGDAKRLCELRVAEGHARMVICDEEPSEQWVEDMAQIDFTIDSIDVTEDAATVSFTQQEGYSTENFILTSEGTMSLLRIDGTWLVAEIELGDPEPTPKTDA